MYFFLRLCVYGLVVLAPAPVQAQGVPESPRANRQHFELVQADSQERELRTPRVSCEGWNTEREMTAEWVRQCLAGGANPNARDDLGATPLYWAATGSSAEVVRILLEAGANPKARGNDGSTPLHIAAVGSSPKVVRILLAAGAEVEARTNIGSTPLHMAAWFGSAEQVRLLLTAGANPNARINGGATPN